MGSFIVRIFIRDGDSGTPWQALFWVGMIAAIGLGGFYAIVWMNADGETQAAALRGVMGCGRALGIILVLRAIAWMLAQIFEW